MIVREILTKFGFKVENDKLDKMSQQLEGIKDRLSVLAGIELAKGLYDLAERFTHLGVELKTAALSAGLTVEAFQELAFSAKLYAVDQGQMETALFRVSRRLYEARTGSAEAQAAFARVGFTIEQVRGFKTSQEVLLALGDRFRQIKDPIERAAVSSELMGRGSMHMVAWLSQGSKAMRAEMEEAKRLGLVLRTDQVEALTQLEHSLTKVSALFNALGGSLAADIAPGIKFIVDKFFEWYEANKKLVDSNIQEWGIQMAGVFGYIIGAVSALALNLLDLAKRFHLEKDIVKTVFWVASLTTGLFALATVLGIVGFIFGSISISSLIFLGIISAIVIAVHDLYQLFEHGFSSTWTGQLLDLLSSSDSWKDKLNPQLMFGGAGSVATSNNYGQNTMNNNLSSTYNTTFGSATPENVSRFEDTMRAIEKEKTDALMSKGPVPLR